MSILEIYLLSGLIITGLTIKDMIVPKDTKRSTGSIVQFFFGLLLIALFLIGGGRFTV